MKRRKENVFLTVALIIIVVSSLLVCAANVTVALADDIGYPIDNGYPVDEGYPVNYGYPVDYPAPIGYPVEITVPIRIAPAVEPVSDSYKLEPIDYHDAFIDNITTWEWIKIKFNELLEMIR